MFVNQEQLLLSALQNFESDLKSNRLGQLSPHQYEKLSEKRLKETGLRSIPIPILAIELWMNRRGMGFDSLYFPSMYCSDILIVLAFAGLMAFSIWYALKPWSQYSRDLRDRQVERAEGRVVQNPKQRGRYTSYSIQIAGQEFKVEGRVMLAFQNGGQYRVYYTPNSRTVVSAEPIGQPL